MSSSVGKLSVDSNNLKKEIFNVRRVQRSKLSIAFQIDIAKVKSRELWMNERSRVISDGHCEVVKVMSKSATALKATGPAV